MQSWYIVVSWSLVSVSAIWTVLSPHIFTSPIRLYLWWLPLILQKVRVCTRDWKINAINYQLAHEVPSSTTPSFSGVHPWTGGSSMNAEQWWKRKSRVEVCDPPSYALCAPGP